MGRPQSAGGGKGAGHAEPAPRAVRPLWGPTRHAEWGKVAATFVDVSTGKAVRIAARESSKALARSMHPEIPTKNEQQMLAYREMRDEDLFDTQWVKVELGPEEFPGYKGERVVCEQCGEGINFCREVRREGKVLCRACAGESYYTPVAEK